MNIHTEVFGDVLVAHTPEELTEESIASFENCIEQQFESGLIQVVLQMDRSEAYDSAGLTALLDLQDELRARGGNLKVSGLGDPGLKIFEVTRLDQRFDIFESVIDAVSSFQSAS
jgi:anti-anti-sigma factor